MKNKKNFRYLVIGEIRGEVSRHRSLNAAIRSLKRDQDGCVSQGGYSDCIIYDVVNQCAVTISDESE